MERYSSENTNGQNKDVFASAGSDKRVTLLAIASGIVGVCVFITLIISLFPSVSASTGCWAGRFTVCTCPDGRTETYRTNSDGIQKLKEARNDPDSCCYYKAGDSYEWNNDASITYSGLGGRNSSSVSRWIVAGSGTSDMITRWGHPDNSPEAQGLPCVKAGTRLTYYRLVPIGSVPTSEDEALIELSPLVSSINIESVQLEPNEETPAPAPVMPTAPRAKTSKTAHSASSVVSQHNPPTL